MVEVEERLKELCQKDGVPKRIRITFPNGDYRTLTNEDVLAESMRFTENLCSATTFKFGLCEANVFEIKTLYVKDTLKGKTIRPFIDYYDKLYAKWYEMPLGEFIIDSHKKDGVTPVKTLIAYGREADLEPITDFYHLYELTGYSVAYAPMYAEYVIIPSTFGKEKCDWFPWIPSVSYDKHWLGDDPEWEHLLITRFLGDYYTPEHAVPVNESWMLWLNVGLETIQLNPKSATTSMYFSEGKIVTEGIDKVIHRLEKNYEDICKTFRTGKPIYEEREMTSDDIVDLVTHMHWKERTSNDRIMREIGGYHIVEGLDMNGENGKVYCYPIVKSIGWQCQKYIVIAGQVIELEVDRGEWVIDMRPDPIECLKDIQIDRADETNMIYNPDRVIGMKRKRPPWLDSKAEYRNYIEDFFELYAAFGRTNRYGMFERYEINSRFAEYASQKTKAGQITVSNGKNNFFIDTNARAGAYFEDYEVAKIGTVIFDWGTTVGGQTVVTTAQIKFSDEPNTYYIQGNYHLTYEGFTWDRTVRIIENCFIPNLKNITWRPMNVHTPALPFVECGDIIRVDVAGEKMDTFVHTRTMQGLQLLTDNIASDVSEYETYKDVDIKKSIIINV